MERIYRNKVPLYGADRTVEIYAARNENEAFQVAIDASERLKDVTLSVTEAVHENGKSIIPSDCFKIERIQDLYISSPVRGKAGWHPDGLLPWRECDIEAGRRKVAWVSVSVEKDTPAGVYRGKFVARAVEKKIELPMKITVFGFELPKRPAMTALIGISVDATRMGRDATKWFRGDESRYVGRLSGKYVWDKTSSDYAAVLSLARMMAERRMSLHHYYSWASPYPAPWRYDRGNRTAQIDSTMFDHNLQILLEELGMNCITLAAQFRTGGPSPGLFQDGGSWITTVASAHRRHDEAFSNKLARAWARAMGSHLKEKGWLDRAFVYVSDEPRESVLQTTTNYSRTLKEAYPPLKTFAAGIGRYGWRQYYAYLNAFSGFPLMEEARKRFRDQDSEYWGVYNRMPSVTSPLASARIIGLDSWARGYPTYFHWSSTFMQSHNFWINSKGFWYHPGPPGYPEHTFVRGIEGLVGNLVYIWPDDEPLPIPVHRPAESQLIMPIGTEGNVTFIPAGQDRPFASTLRLEALRESIDDYEYMELLRKISESTAENSPLRKQVAGFRQRLQILLNESNLKDDVHAAQERGTFLVATESLQSFRRDVAAAIEEATRR